MKIKSQIGPPEGGYGPPEGGYGPPEGDYRPPEGGYGPPEGDYRPPEGDYRQPEDGYRFSADSVELAHFAPREVCGKVADLGAGCGVVGLEAIGSGRFKGFSEMYLVEAEEIYRESLGENVRVFGQGHQGRIKIVMADWRHLGPRELGGPLDYAIVNPPYFPLGSSGPIKAGRQRGRHETRGDLGDLFKAAQRLLKAGRPLALCWPRARLGALIGAAAENGFALVKLRLPPRPGSALVLAEFRS